MHVHVAIEGADRAIYVADGIRRYLPLLLALSANSPFWGGERTGIMSTRTPVFRAFPRVGHPAALRDLGDLLAPGAADDGLGGDRRLHIPLVGRPRPSQLRHGRDPGLRPADAGRGTLAPLVSLTVCPRAPAARRFDAGEPLIEQPERADRRQQDPRRGPRHGGRARRLPARQARRRHRDLAERSARHDRRGRRGARLRGGARGRQRARGAEAPARAGSSRSRSGRGAICASWCAEIVARTRPVQTARRGYSRGA